MVQFILLAVFASQAVFAAGEYGTFMVVKGKVLIEGASGMTEAKFNSKIQVGETVITDTDSRAKIVMFDRNIINVGPNTKLKFEKYSNSKDDKNVKLKLIEGKVRSKVGEKYDNNSSKYEIRTATAVAGVRGTDFIASYDPATKTTEILTFRGQVSFTNLAVNGVDLGGDPVLVKKGEKSQSREGNVSVPAKVSPNDLNQADKDSSVENKDAKDKEMQKDKDKKDAKKDGKKLDDETSNGITNQPPIPEAPISNIGTTSPPIDRSKSKVKINITTPQQ